LGGTADTNLRLYKHVTKYVARYAKGTMLICHQAAKAVVLCVLSGVPKHCSEYRSNFGEAALKDNQAFMQASIMQLR